uniref:Uncharacterized protein n=1 Tax=Mycoplasma suis TaxID=57372 RepID=Q8KM87_9MOLU|nr:hypothetical protein [Mycoplasma suis]
MCIAQSPRSLRSQCTSAKTVPIPSTIGAGKASHSGFHGAYLGLESTRLVFTKGGTRKARFCKLCTLFTISTAS